MRPTTIFLISGAEFSNKYPPNFFCSWDIKNFNGRDNFPLEFALVIKSSSMLSCMSRKKSGFLLSNLVYWEKIPLCSNTYVPTHYSISLFMAPTVSTVLRSNRDRLNIGSIWLERSIRNNLNCKRNLAQLFCMTFPRIALFWDLWRYILLVSALIMMLIHRLYLSTVGFILSGMENNIWNSHFWVFAMLWALSTIVFFLMCGNSDAAEDFFLTYSLCSISQ